MRSLLSWKRMSPAILKRQFRLTYREFLEQKSFEKQCRLLLDLFKLEIVLAAVIYDCGND